ncbi:O-antigen ligase family protein [Microvirga aerophila]|uniref:O-antigen ligase-related domain-containing protein n=1 Tax=Microvirga aerophila TaxID=670291 RepID=A0A512BUX2_9HYPH|nr:O-antigen ligase family protein [Microvirga aerophila]GEO15766.1 hypothetical protein MAE02_34620 [Microvirga aerophila]
MFLGALAWLPFWLGSNDTLAWSLNAALFGGLVAVYHLTLLIKGISLPVPLSRLSVPATLVALLAVWIALQAVSWTPEAWHHPLWATAREALNGPVAGAVSLNGEATALALLRLLTAVAVFWLAVQFGHSRSNARTCLYAVVVIGSAYAVYGLIAHTLFPTTILWLEKEAYLDSVTSTFINRNTYATYAGLGLMVGIALLTREIEKVGEGRTWKDKLENAIAGLLGPGLRLMVLCLLLALALLLTGSRAGITSTFAALFVFVALLALRARSSKLVATGWALAVLGLIAALIGLVGEFYLDRLEQAGSHIGSRLDVYALTWSAALDRLWLGTGYGSFADAFPAYRDATISGFGQIWDKAHNTYVELFLGLGFPGAIILMLALIVLVGQAIAAVRHDRGYGPAALTACAASLLVGLHALVDFSLQIQAVTLTYVALLGLGVSQHNLPKSGRDAKPSNKTFESRPGSTMT